MRGKLRIMENHLYPKRGIIENAYTSFEVYRFFDIPHLGYTVQNRCRNRLQNRYILRDQLLFPTSIYRLVYTSQENNLHIQRDMCIYRCQPIAGWSKRYSVSTFYADHEYDFRIFLSLKFKILGYFLDFFSYMFNLARTALLIPTSLTDI